MHSLGCKRKIGKSVAQFKGKVQEQLTTRFSLDALEATPIEVVASALDPRFRELSFLELLEREEVKQVFIYKTRAESAKSSEQLVAKGDGEPPRKRSKTDELLD